MTAEHTAIYDREHNDAVQPALQGVMTEQTGPARTRIPKGELGAERWERSSRRRRGLGISFILLAGGEPLKRPEVLERAAETRGVIFPVFTNGTLLSGDILGLFGRSRNLIPVVSVEGDKHQTDSRRGPECSI